MRRKAFAKQLSQILTHVETLKQYDTTGVEPTATVLGQVNVFRPDDVVRPSLPVEQAVANAPESADGCFAVPKIIEEGSDNPIKRGESECFRQMLRSKIHRATVTESCLDYEGSLTIDEDLMEAAGILPYEAIICSNLNNGERFMTYADGGQTGRG